jgi:hypothetical protein
MTYRRVIPRDLFNEANLLKCMGRLALLREHMLAEDVAEFRIEQDESDGSISVVNLPLWLKAKTYRLFRPLNSRAPWPLYLTYGDDDIAVFDEYGDLTQQFAELTY